MTRPSLAHFTRLRRLADDGGRFMIVDLRGARDALLADLVVGLAPFATAVVLDVDAEQAVWRRFGSAHVGRIDGCAAAGDVALAEATAADAVLGDLASTLPRLGADAAAEIGLGSPGRCTEVLVGVDHPDALAAAGVDGYLAPASFWREMLPRARDERRRLIADDLVPRLQRMNAATADLPRARWRGD